MGEKFVKKEEVKAQAPEVKNPVAPIAEVKPVMGEANRPVPEVKPAY